MSRNPLSLFSHASDAAGRISTLAWFMIVLAAAVFAIVVALTIVAVRRNRPSDPTEVDLRPTSNRLVVWGGAVIPSLVFVTVFVVALSAMHRLSPAPPAVTIRVIGHQWWWDAEYLDANGRTSFHTANEVHIPVDAPVRILLTSADVIHAFWVPQLQGKLDVVPGDTNDLRLLAKYTGTYAGACAEFCGQQHAHMAFTVVADSVDAYHAWLERQTADAIAPADSLAEAGRTLFAVTDCANCHSIRGATTRADSAPDLTHVGSRFSIAAGTRPRSLGNLEGWIANPQALKPGAKMPTLRAYTGPELRALATYLEGLK